MKQKIILIAFTLLGVATFYGCKKSSSSPSYSMKASLGATAYSAGNCIASSDGAGGLTITGLGGATTAPTFPYVSIQIAVWSNATGTFNFDSTGVNNFAQYILSDSTARTSKTGSVVVTAVSSTAVTGNFTFTCTDGTVVTGGTFNAKKI
jgi:hypothetical protein